MTWSALAVGSTFFCADDSRRLRRSGFFLVANLASLVARIGAYGSNMEAFYALVFAMPTMIALHGIYGPARGFMTLDELGLDGMFHLYAPPVSFIIVLGSALREALCVPTKRIADNRRTRTKSGDGSIAATVERRPSRSHVKRRLWRHGNASARLIAGAKRK